MRPVGAPRQIGSYAILSELGRGGMGIVYLAQRASGERLALKTIPIRDTDPKAVQRFVREAETLERVDHRGIVRLHEVGRYEQGYFLAQELIEGETLEAYRERRGQLTPVEVAEVGVALGRALDAVHQGGVLHRDVKPKNVMIRAADRSPVLLDFGLARYATAESLTKSGDLLGTPAYMSPEQAMGERDLTPAVDIYGLGATLYAALSGVPPAHSEALTEQLLKIVNEEPPPLREARPDVPEPLAAVIHKALAKDPSERYPSAAELAGDLERFLLGEGTHAGEEARRSLLPFVLGGLGLLLALGALFAFGSAPSPAPSPSLARATPSAPPSATPTATRGAFVPSSDQLLLVPGLGERLVLFRLDAQGQLHHRSQREPNGAFGPWETLTGVEATRFSARANLDGRLEVFWLRRSDRAVMHAYQWLTGAWSPERNEQGFTARALELGRSGQGRLVLLSAKGPGLLTLIWQESPNQPFRGGGSGGLEGIEEVSISANEDGRIEAVFVHGGQLTKTHQQVAGDPGSLAKPYTFPLGRVRDAQVLLRGDGVLELYAWTRAGALHFAQQRAPNQSWHPLTRIGADVFELVAAPEGQSRTLVVTRDREGQLWARSRRRGGSVEPERVRHARGSALALAANQDGTLALAYVDPAGEVCLLQRRGGGWEE